MKREEFLLEKKFVKSEGFEPKKREKREKQKKEKRKARKRVLKRKVVGRRLLLVLKRLSSGEGEGEDPL